MKHSFEKKLNIFSQVLNGRPIKHLSLELAIQERMILEWVRKYNLSGESGLHKQPNIKATSAMKEEIVRLVIDNSLPLPQLILQYGVSRTALESWVRLVRAEGYTALYRQQKRGRQLNYMGRPRKQEPQTELEKLQAENTRLKAENALLKKVQALVQEREARERMNGQKPSKN